MLWANFGQTRFAYLRRRASGEDLFLAIILAAFRASRPPFAGRGCAMISAAKTSGARHIAARVNSVNANTVKPLG
jgi:hypothetical protein